MDSLFWRPFIFLLVCSSLALAYSTVCHDSGEFSPLCFEQYECVFIGLLRHRGHPCFDCKPHKLGAFHDSGGFATCSLRPSRHKQPGFNVHKQSKHHLTLQKWVQSIKSCPKITLQSQEHMLAPNSQTSIVVAVQVVATHWCNIIWLCIPGIMCNKELLVNVSIWCFKPRVF